MKRIITTLVFTFSLSMASLALGADGVKLGFVDVQKVLLNSNAGKEAKEHLAEIAGKYVGEKNTREEELKSLQAALEKQKMFLSETARKDKEKDYQQKLKEYQRFLKDAQDEIQAKNDELTNKIVGEIVKMAQSYGRDNGYTTVFVKNDAMIYVEDKADLTDELLKSFNASKIK
jgi:outer membrane protein